MRPILFPAALFFLVPAAHCALSVEPATPASAGAASTNIPNGVCNDKTRPGVMLDIKGTLWKPFEVSPQMAVLKVLSDSPSNPPVTVTIVSNLKKPVTLSNPVNTNAAFAAELDTVRPGKEFQLIIRMVPPFTQGTVQGTIQLRTSSTNAPSLEVPVLAIVQPGWVVTPTQITLPPGPLDREVPYAVSIQNNAGPGLALSEPSLNGNDVGIEIKELAPGHQFTLTCTFPSGFQVPQSGHVNLTVKTSDPQHPVIQVPVYQGVWTGPRDIGLPALHRGPVPPTATP
jgi:hypothetical protein